MTDDETLSETQAAAAHSSAAIYPVGTRVRITVPGDLCGHVGIVQGASAVHARDLTLVYFTYIVELANGARVPVSASQLAPVESIVPHLVAARDFLLARSDECGVWLNERVVILVCAGQYVANARKGQPALAPRTYYIVDSVDLALQQAGVAPDELGEGYTA